MGVDTDGGVRKVRIFELSWDNRNEEHIDRHGVVPEEANQVVWNRAYITRGRRHTYRVLGPTDAGRLLPLVVARHGGGFWYVVTARNADDRERREYRRHERSLVRLRFDRQPPSKVPEVATLQDEAEFRDTPSTSEFEEEWEPVDVEVSPTLRSRFFLLAEVDRATLRRVRELARVRGLTNDELVGLPVADGLVQTGDGVDDPQAYRS